MQIQTPKGFRDFLPKDALKRQLALEKIKEVFESFGFDPLETPTLEYEEVLTGKYGEEEKLIYKFEAPGGEKVALRYDQTVPTSRVVAQYGPTGKQLLPIPFKRYQIQSAYRGENTQKGRYREFLQCDGDIIGISSSLADAEILSLVYKIYQNLGLEIIIKINDRLILAGIEAKYLASIDKLEKIREIGVVRELGERGLSEEEAGKLLKKVSESKINQNLEEIIKLAKDLGIPAESLSFQPTLVRGLDYYTGLIFEVVLKDNPNSQSLCGGGRYDKLIGKFSGTDIPATGFAIGFDRTLEAMDQSGVQSDLSTNSQVLVTVFSPELAEKSLEVSSILRAKNINTEVWLDPNNKLDKQLKYADQKGIRYALILGPDEVKDNKVTLKDLKTNSQQTISLDEIVQKLSS